MTRKVGGIWRKGEGECYDAEEKEEARFTTGDTHVRKVREGRRKEDEKEEEEEVFVSSGHTSVGITFLPLRP